ncbi:MAG TPA: hypothetical protein VNS22_21780 [Geminicoccus sp.]|nr:hypothetical protein [Geminicoccus sp.]
MSIFLASLAAQLDPGTHAVLILDQAGWQGGIDGPVARPDLPGAAGRDRWGHFKQRLEILP